MHYLKVTSHVCREADKDMVVMGYRIPKGTPLILAPYPMHVSPHNYVQPHKFWPDRWMLDTTPADDPKHSGSLRGVTGLLLPCITMPAAVTVAFALDAAAADAAAVIFSEDAAIVTLFRMYREATQ